jgi:hypothetical protein
MRIWEELGSVAAAGAVGGALSWIYSAAVGQTLLPWYSRLPASILCGAGASIVAVYVLANSDLRGKQSFVRGLAFALVCGFAWKPVYDATYAFEEKAMRLKTIGNDAEALRTQAGLLPSTPTANLPAKIGETKTRALALLSEAYKVEDPNTKKKVLGATTALVEALKPSEDRRVEEAQIDTLKDLGTRAHEVNDQDLLKKTVESLKQLNWSENAKAAAQQTLNALVGKIES